MGQNRMEWNATEQNKNSSFGGGAVFSLVN